MSSKTKESISGITMNVTRDATLYNTFNATCDVTWNSINIITRDVTWNVTCGVTWNAIDRELEHVK